MIALLQEAEWLENILKSSKIGWFYTICQNLWEALLPHSKEERGALKKSGYGAIFDSGNGPVRDPRNGLGREWGNFLLVRVFF